MRGSVIPSLGQTGRSDLLKHINHLSVVNRAIDHDMMLYLHQQPARQTLNRHSFVQLPHAVALEVMAGWLKSHGITNYTRKQLEQLVAKSKTLDDGKRIDIDIHHKLLIGNESIVLTTPVPK